MFPFHLRSLLDSSSCSECLPNKETGKRRKWHGFYFQPKSPTDRPQAVSLPLSLSLSFSLVFSLPLLAVFLHRISPWTVCPSIPQLSLLCYKLGELCQPAHELGQLEQREVRGNGTLGQLGGVKWGTGGNSSGSCIPSAHQAISGTARGRTKQELIRGQWKQRKLTWQRVTDGGEN